MKENTHSFYNRFSLSTSIFKLLPIFLFFSFAFSKTYSQTVTIASGNNTSKFVPFYGYYMDQKQKSQFIYPQSMLGSLRGEQITELKFYSVYTFDFTGSINIKMGITLNSNLATNWDNTALSTVYSGTASLTSEGNNKVLKIVLNTPFLYPSTGGNLLIMFDKPLASGNSVGSAAYVDNDFYGMFQNESARYVFGTSNYDANQNAVVDNFLPKISFTYSCSPITSFPYSESFESYCPSHCWTIDYENTNPNISNTMLHVPQNTTVPPSTHNTPPAKDGTSMFRFCAAADGYPYAQYLFSPEINSASSLQLSFWHRKSMYMEETFRVGYSSTTKEIYRFTWGQTIRDISDTEWIEYTAIVPAGTKYIAIHYNVTNPRYFLYIDNFKLSSVCSLSVSPNNRDVVNTLCNTSFSVSNSGTGTMPWRAAVTSGNSWLSITDGSTGTNNGTITCIVSANSGAERTGTITITSTGASGSPKTVTVTQAAEAVQTHTITASVNGIGGTINPTGNVTVNHNANQIFTITPNAGYIISEVLVDNFIVTNQLVNNTYTFRNVIADHTIKANFTSTNVNIELNDIVSIYPNPANDILNISSNEVINTIEIISITGQKILFQIINDINAKFDTKNLVAGNYFIKITTNNNVHIRLFSKSE